MHYLIIDDHLLFAGGLARLLEQSLAPCETTEVRTAEEAEKVLRAMDEQPDLILMDLNLPGISGLTLIRRLQQMCILSPVMMISASDSLADAGKALEHGAVGYLPKSSPPEVLIKAIQEVLDGGTYLPEGWLELIESQKQEMPEIRLTPRQQEILHLLAQGMSNKVIASELDISENTIKGHLRDVFRLFRVTNRTACLNEVRRLGLLVE
ncbi:MAG: response regulator transcription factor [Pseudomonadota bacterium]|nr:response regulator transcription factor [Pseudomonadota bacterium]MEC8102437.1 response regulator transcription factor [Pseudomonadota bacterium]MEC8442582.1 response regulator transcription factor [Pseudomonadota bacterium]